MKTIKANWIWIGVGIILLVAFFGYIHNCTGKKADVKIETTSDKAVKKLTIDSMNIVFLKVLKNQNDSLTNIGDSRVKQEEAKNNDLKAENKSLKVSNDTLYKKYYKTHTLGSCDSLVAGQRKELTSNTKVIRNQDTIITILKANEVQLKVKNNLSDSIIKIQTDQIKTISNEFIVYKTETTKKEKSEKFWSGVKNVGLVAAVALLVLKSL